MKCVNVNDARERLPELLLLLENDPNEEIILMSNHEPVFKISRIGGTAPVDEKILRKRGFGIAKSKFNFPPDFDEAFVAMDTEILKSFSEGVTK